jgi:hypothetical protein
MVVVVMANHHDIDKRYVFDFARRWRESLQRFHVDGCATILENRIKKDAQARWIFDQVACVAEPCGAQFWRLARVMEIGLADRDSRGSCVWRFGFTCEFAPSKVSQSFGKTTTQLTRLKP